MDTFKREQKQLKTGMSLVYFFYLMSFSILIVVLPMYMKSMGYTDTQVGFVIGASSFVSVFASFAWGVIDDRMKRTQRLLQILFLGLFVGSLFLGNAKLFGLFLFARMLFEVFNSGFNPLADKTAIEIETHYDVPFNHMRVFGSVGYALILFPIVLLVEKFDNYFVIFAVMGVCFICLLLASQLLKPLDKINDAVEVAEQIPVFESVKIILQDRALVLVGIVFILMMSILDVSSNFQSIHMSEGLGAPINIISIASFISAGISEVPFMFLAPKIQKRIGPFNCLMLSASLFLLRYVLEGVTMTIAVFLLIKLLHGLYVSLFFGPILLLVKRHVPMALFATAVSLLTAVKGILSAILSPIVGWLLDTTGSTFSMYPLFIVGMVATLIVLFRYKTKYQAMYQHDTSK